MNEWTLVKKKLSSPFSIFETSISTCEKTLAIRANKTQVYNLHEKIRFNLGQIKYFLTVLKW